MSDIKPDQVRCTITDVDGHAHEVKSVAADRQPSDPRMQVVLGLLPADAVFLVRRGYVADEDSENPTHVDALLWRPKSSGYVSQYNPWQAGFYSESPNPTHSRAVRVDKYLSSYPVQDDTPLALLVDEIIRLREELGGLQTRVDRALAITGPDGEHTIGSWSDADAVAQMCAALEGAS